MNDDLAVTTPDQSDRSATAGQPRDAGVDSERRASPKARARTAGTLADVIAHEILPRLLLEHRAPARAVSDGQSPFSEAEYVAFAESALAVDAAPLIALTERYLDGQIDVEAVLLSLMVPAARHLGLLWERDDITFVDVTIAVQRMQFVLRDICDTHRVGHPSSGARVLLLPTPGETHTFGLLMLGELFRRRGWSVTGGLPMGEQELIDTLSTQSFALVGFSLSTDALLDSLGHTIKLVRASARNPDLKVTAGGRVFIGRPELAQQIGADGVFSDADEALSFADHVLETQSPRRRGEAPYWDGKQ